MYTKHGRIIILDMDAIIVPESEFLSKNRVDWVTGTKSKKLDPFSNSFLRKRYTDPKELQERVNAYFDSCFGVRYYKGHPMYDIEGEPLIGQIEPFTLSGLARYLGICRNTLKNYELKSKAGLIPPEYYEIIQDARMRVQEYAEKRLYDRDGSTGARFVLEAGFGWMTEKDRKELKQSKERIKVTQEKLQLLKDAAASKTLDDKEFVVSILRASNEN